MKDEKIMETLEAETATAAENAAGGDCEAENTAETAASGEEDLKKTEDTPMNGEYVTDRADEITAGGEVDAECGAETAAGGEPDAESGTETAVSGDADAESVTETTVSGDDGAGNTTITDESGEYSLKTATEATTSGEAAPLTVVREGVERLAAAARDKVGTAKSAGDLRSLATVMRYVNEMLRDFYNDPTPGDAQARRIAAERMEMDREKAALAAASDAADGIEVVIPDEAEEWAE